MLRTRFAIFCLLALAWFASPVLAACPKGEIVAKTGCVKFAVAKQEIERIVIAAMEAHKLKAVLAGVSVGGETVMREAWGESMTGVPATPDMHFRNGAVAIAYIGTVLLQLQDQKILSVDDKLSKWFPGYPKASEITLAMLISGTSGYADYVTDDGFVKRLYADPFQRWTPDELIKIAFVRQMPCNPGECWSYAHTNFVILGQVIEKATGKPFADVIRAGILEPLALKDTRSEETAIIQEPVLHAFDDERGTYEESTYWDPSWTLAKGAIQTSNIADILTSARAVGLGTLLSPESHTLQLAPGTAKFHPWNEKMYYGYGVFVINDWIVQNPSFAGYAATMTYLPSEDLAIAVSVTVKEGASTGNLSTVVTKAIAAYLAPDKPL
ncbi:MAG: serine hydrolase domain-containing protein [Hyphomicrobiales bacterium]